MKAEDIAREIMVKHKAYGSAGLTKAVATALRAAEARGEARGYERAREQAAQIANEQDHIGASMEWGMAADTIASEIRAMQPETNP